MARTMIRDEDWAKIEHLLPQKKSRRGRPSINNRIIVEGILWVLRTGAPWRDLPGSFPPWKSVYTRFWRWSKIGVWDEVWKHLKKRCRPRITYPGLLDCESPSACLQSILQIGTIEGEYGKIQRWTLNKNSCCS
jgi:transposase